MQANPSCASQTPELTPLSLSHLCAKYLRVRFQNELNERSSVASATLLAQPLMLPVALASELDIIASILAKAFFNRKALGWDATRYAERLPKNSSKPGTKASNKREKALKKRYPPLNEVTASTPCIIVDMQGIILAWYLPGILADSRQNKMLEARNILGPLLGTDETGSSWRDDPTFFYPEEGPEGVANLSPAWFQLGYDGLSQKYPHPSANFKTPVALAWLTAISESNAILSAILAVIHPKLYDAGWQTTMRLQSTPETGSPDVLREWASVFSGVAVISNRTTPRHRDRNSRFHWYEMLAALGRYKDCDLELPGLGISLEYGAGTVVGISGSVLEHSVPSFKGDRVCYAYFMRNNVHEWANIPASDWMRTNFYE